VRRNVDSYGEYSDHFANCMPERRLWATVLMECNVKACAGDALCINFFKTSGGMFSTLCSLMGLPEQEIRLRVLRKAALKLQQKINNKENCNENE
jgi:hypothetical protein